MNVEKIKNALVNELVMNGLTVEQLSEKLKIPIGSLRNILYRNTKRINFGNLKLIADYFGKDFFKLND